jgi:lipopolysaccharide/colanic/teichoic acid biosynthesis glycosyltransferase
MKEKKIYEFFKRIFDIVFSILGLIIFSPIFILIAVLIKINSPGPIFFKQDRIGKNGKIFTIYKFRTMVEDAEKRGVHFTTPSTDSRLTKIGLFLRRFDIDEFPQLINILKGEMSVVGPRPEVPEIVELYDKKQKEILLVKPGMTSLATLKFLKEGETMKFSKNLYKDYTKDVVPQKIELDFKYIETRSFWGDIKLIIQTIFKIVFG